MNTKNYDSDFCGSLPIHLINLIQPYGALVVVDKETVNIVQVSENATDVFGVSTESVINTPFKNYLSSGSDKEFLTRFDQDADKIPVLCHIAGKSFMALVHALDLFYVVEIDLTPYNEKKQISFLSVYQEIKYAINIIQGSNTIPTVAENCAKQIKLISGYDKVMIYCFDDDWNGTVIAEEKEDEMESYLGITFPASDVPKQARLLYQRNPFRFIPTREYQPVKLYPVINPITGSFIDLSDCNVRSVAAVHLEYLKNMGVMSSMSVRILNGDNLWGLIACHHRTPKMLSFEIRSVIEMLCNIISARITNIQGGERSLFSMHLKEQYKNIVEEAYRSRNLQKALLNGDPDILKLFNVEGVAIILNENFYAKGNIPDKEDMRELILWLHAKQLRHIFYTDSLSGEFDQAGEFKSIASGLMVIPINHEADEYVIMFRPEVVKVINWGGNPEERIQFEDRSQNYHPRNSFKKWQQLVQGKSRPWREDEVLAAENLRSFIYEFVSIAS
jgi:two-component system, chemotaxis family, sensor kinase Cph1